MLRQAALRQILPASARGGNTFLCDGAALKKFLTVDKPGRLRAAATLPRWVSVCRDATLCVDDEAYEGVGNDCGNHVGRDGGRALAAERGERRYPDRQPAESSRHVISEPDLSTDDALDRLHEQRDRHQRSRFAAPLGSAG